MSYKTRRVLADFLKARRRLGWEPTVGFNEMAKKMIAAQMLRLKGNALNQS